MFNTAAYSLSRRKKQEKEINLISLTENISSLTIIVDEKNFATHYDQGNETIGKQLLIKNVISLIH